MTNIFKEEFVISWFLNEDQGDNDNYHYDGDKGNKREKEYKLPLRQCYRFIRDDVKLCAEINKLGNQKLLMVHFDPKTKKILLVDSISCIHTAVTTISGGEFLDYIEDQDEYNNLENKIINAMSSETLEEIHLEIPERFKAFKSWVQGIAEAGVNAFQIQTEIEQLARFAYPISNKLLNFMCKVDPEFLDYLLDRLEIECKYEGVYHKNSLTTNIIQILNIIERMYLVGDINKADYFLRRILNMDIDYSIFFDIKDWNKLAYPKIVTSELFKSKAEEIINIIMTELKGKLNKFNLHALPMELEQDFRSSPNRGGLINLEGFPDKNNSDDLSYKIGVYEAIRRESHKVPNILAGIIIYYVKMNDFERGYQLYKKYFLDSGPSFLVIPFELYLPALDKMDKVGANNELDWYFTKFWEDKYYLVAELLLKASLKSNPDLVYAWNNLGFIYKELGRYSDALRYLDKCMEKDPSDYIAWINKADIFRLQGRYEESERLYMEIYKNFPEARQCNYFWKNLGLLNISMGKQQIAYRLFKKSLRISLDERVYVELGKLEEKKKRYKNALVNYTIALVRAPLFKKAWLHYAKVKDKLRQTKNNKAV
ncbi:MAG: tetratricopeptide repeat protein [Promethearchaeota archaeon]